MKNIVLLPALLMLCLFSCTKPENESVVLESRNEIENIYAYSMNEDRGKDVLDVSYSANKDIIYLTTRALPENETPVDISAVIIELTAWRLQSAALKAASRWTFLRRKTMKLKSR